jgi:predicted short-subunit dehydrogenase-like oxidoreductase (DUF2520 family)
MVYGIVGDGRVARHMQTYFDQLGVAWRSWSRRQMQSDGVKPLESLADVDVVLLLIADDAIESFIDQWPQLQKKKLVHFSGALISRRAVGCHPLQTFGPELYEQAEYEGIPFVVDAGGPDFNQLFSQLPNPHYPLDKEKKQLYHAYCVLSGNFSTLLWQQAFNGFEERLGLKREILLPYLERLSKNLAADSKTALTGPLARDDQQTMAKNLAALDEVGLKQLYQTFIDHFAK